MRIRIRIRIRPQIWQKTVIRSYQIQQNYGAESGFLSKFFFGSATLHTYFVTYHLISRHNEAFLFQNKRNSHFLFLKLETKWHLSCIAEQNINNIVILKKSNEKLSDFLTVSVSLGRAGVLALISVSAFSLWDSWLRLASRAFRSPSLRVLPAQTHNHLSQLYLDFRERKNILLNIC